MSVLFNSLVFTLIVINVCEARFPWIFRQMDSHSDEYGMFPSSSPFKRKPNPVQVLCNPLLTDGDMLGSGSSTGSSATNAKVQLWPHGVIPYEIHQDLWQEEDLIHESMRHIEEQTCIKFKPRDGEKDYVGIIKGTGCYSYVGKLNRGGAQPLSIGEGCEFSGSVIHELIHVVGFHHEHSRMDRDKYVKIMWNNLTPQTVKQFAKVDPKKYPQYYTFDYDSVMLYGSTAFSKDGRSPTLVPIRGGRKRLTEVYHKHGMSPIDTKRIRRLYNCGHHYGK